MKLVEDPETKGLYWRVNNGWPECCIVRGDMMMLGEWKPLPGPTITGSDTRIAFLLSLMLEAQS